MLKQLLKNVKDLLENLDKLLDSSKKLYSDSKPKKFSLEINLALPFLYFMKYIVFLRHPVLGCKEHSEMSFKNPQKSETS